MNWVDYIPFISAGTTSMKAPIIVRLIEAFIIAAGTWFGTVQTLKQDFAVFQVKFDSNIDVIKQDVSDIKSDVAQIKRDFYPPRR